MKLLYYDCFAGISGDMHLGAMIDLGVDPGYIEKELLRLELTGWELKTGKESRKGILGTRAEVAVTAHESHHSHAHFKDIRNVIRKSSLSRNIKDLSLRIFTSLAEAEGTVHGRPVEEVTFHEVGAVDSIIDIVGAAVCIDYLKPDRIIAAPVELGSGTVTCAHGILPVPAPAVVELLKGVPVKTGAQPFEATTPTGAAILRTVVDEFSDSLSFTPEKTGYGIGCRDGKIPNILRVMQGEPDPKRTRVPESDAVILECNIDDMNPELYEPVIETLLEKGAHDVFLTPIIMKKSRPGILLRVLSPLDKQRELEAHIFEETTTFGLRSYRVGKKSLSRDMRTIESPFGPVRIKSGYLGGKRIKSKPEFEDCRRIAREYGVPLSEVYRELEKTADREREQDGKEY